MRSSVNVVNEQNATYLSLLLPALSQYYLYSIGKARQHVFLRIVQGSLCLSGEGRVVPYFPPYETQRKTNPVFRAGIACL
jgi:hypothetical protein